MSKKDRRIIQSWKNLDIIVWSRGGKRYAETQHRRIAHYADSRKIKFYSKLDYETIRSKYDKIITIDNIQDTKLGDVNLIVRNK